MDIAYIMQSPTRRMSHVHRYSSFPVHRQENVADHSWWVAFLTMLICKDLNEQGHNVDVGQAVSRALVHDLSECISGDIIRSYKYSSPEMLGATAAADEANMRELTSKLGRGVGRRVFRHWQNAKSDTLGGDVVKFADMVSVVFYCAEERASGNRYVEQIVKEMYETWFSKFHSHPELGQYADQLFPTKRFFDIFRFPKPEAAPVDPAQLTLLSHREGPVAQHDWSGDGDGRVPLS